MSVRDRFGKELQVNDWVVYGKGWFDVGMVIQVEESNDPDDNYSIDDDHEYLGTNGGGRIRVIGVATWAPMNIGNRRWIRDMMTVLKVDPSCIPDAIRNNAERKIEDKLTGRKRETKEVTA